MYSPELLDHFRNPRNAGELEPPAICVDVVNPACGDTLRLTVLWEAGRVAQSAYRIRGCTASIAAGSVLTGLIQGKSAAELRLLRTANIETELGGLEPASRHAATLCLDAVKALLGLSGRVK